MPPTSLSTPNEGKPNVLIIPNPLEPLDEEDYPEIQYWHDENWIKHIEQQKDCGESVLQLGFLTDRDRNLIAELWIKIFMSTAKQAWNELYCHRLDPSS